VFTDLTGQRVGELQVLAELAPEDRGYGRVRSYLCRCSCGTEQRIEHSRLIARPGTKQAVDRCDTCRFTRKCETCGGNFVSQQYKATCSDECKRERLRLHHLASYYRRSTADPDFNKKANARAKEILASDPARAEQARIREKARADRRRADPVERNKLNSDYRKRYARNRDEILSRRKQRLADASPERRAEMIEARRASERRYWEANREEIIARRRELRLLDVEAYNAYQRWRWRERRRMSAEAQLLKLQEALAERVSKSTTED